jgi:hypothetical protein
MKFVGTIFLFVIFGCKNEPITYPDGGHAFINTDTIKDKSFPYFPIRDSILSIDSIYAVIYEANFMKLFDEPNISLKPSEKEIFRLSISGMGIPHYYFTITDGKIIAKKGLQNKMFDGSINKVSENEQNLYHLLYMYVLMNDKDQEGQRKPRYNLVEKKQIDSCKKIGIPICYKYLFEKFALPLSKQFKYETRIITLPRHTYKSLIDKINNSGYWKLPLELDCNDRPNDGVGFSLEANNGKKYNLVSSGNCMDPSSDFKRTCQQIISYAHYEIKIDYTTPR